MNIIIVDCFDPWEHRVDLLTKVFLEMGHTVTCLMSDFRHIDKVRRTDKKENTLFFSAEPYRKNISFARLRSHMKLSKDIFRWIEEHENNIDLLWVLAPPNSFIKDAASIRKKHTHIKLIIDLIDLWPESMPIGGLKRSMFLWKELRDSNLKYADIVVTECDLYRKILNKQLDGVNTYRLYLAREDNGYESHLQLPDDLISLCYLGSINNIIDIDAIGQIIKKCATVRPVLLHIVGDGERKKELIDISMSFGARVVDHGKSYDRKQKQEIFDSCHYGLNTFKRSVCVGLTMKSIDYFEFGLPLINTIKGDTWELVNRYSCGINVDRIEDIDIKEIELLSETGMSSRKRCRTVFKEYFTENAFRNNVMEILDLL